MAAPYQNRAKPDLLTGLDISDGVCGQAPRMGSPLSGLHLPFRTHLARCICGVMSKTYLIRLEENDLDQILDGLKARDRKVNQVSRQAGWRVVRIWEHDLARCEVSTARTETPKVVRRIQQALVAARPAASPPAT